MFRNDSGRRSQHVAQESSVLGRVLQVGVEAGVLLHLPELGFCASRSSISISPRRCATKSAVCVNRKREANMKKGRTTSNTRHSDAARKPGAMSDALARLFETMPTVIC